MKRGVGLFCAIALCVSALAGCGGGKTVDNGTRELPEGAWRDSEVTTITYVDNNFIAAAQGNTHYYVSDATATEVSEYHVESNSDACIYREDMTGEQEIEKIPISGEWRWINPVGDYIFYVNCRSGGMVYGGEIERYDIISKESTVYDFSELEGYKYHNLFVVGDKMYFKSTYRDGNNTNERLCRADLDGKNAEILKEDSHFWLLGNDEEYIYYSLVERDENNMRIDVMHALSLDGTEDNKLFEVLSDDYWSFGLGKDSDGKTCIYGQAEATESSVDTDIVMIYNVTAGTKKEIYEYEIDTYDTNYRFRVRSFGGLDMYFTYRNADDNMSIGKLIPENLATVSIADTKYDEINNISILGDYVYYTTEKKIGGDYYDYIHRVNPDGSVDDITEGFER